jgi:hypothetical protein
LVYNITIHKFIHQNKKILSQSIGWCLQAVEEPVKIQDYEKRPSGNPQPGQFEYKGTPELVNGWYEMVVPLNNFYGIHVDLGCCN